MIIIIKKINIIITIAILFISISIKYKNEIIYIDEIKNNKNEEEIIHNLLYYKEYYSNNDIIGTLKIPGTNIDTLLVKSTNNKYYLNHTIKKEYDEKGTIFVDYRTNLNSKQINIYGHNSNKYTLPFKELENYKDKSFYQNHKLIEIWNGNETIIYQIFSIQIVTDNKEHMNIDNINQSHINKLNESIYETNINAKVDDKILILQTCNYTPKNSYLLIIAKKI